MKAEPNKEKYNDQRDSQNDPKLVELPGSASNNHPYTGSEQNDHGWEANPCSKPFHLSDHFQLLSDLPGSYGQ
jgi:hypothetical protein